MATDVNQAIAAYLQKIHTKLVFPVVIEKGSKNYRPDRLVLFQEAAMRAYLRAVTLFRQPCKADCECESGKCVNGKCGDLVVGPLTLQGGFECMRSQDCQQTERCIDGECVPQPWLHEYVSPDEKPSYGAEVIRAFEDYSNRIYDVLTNGLTENPRTLQGVRTVLLQMYADAAIAGGAARGNCEGADACRDGEWCVDGMCVPIPFRLGFKSLTIPRPDPWK